MLLHLHLIRNFKNELLAVLFLTWKWTVEMNWEKPPTQLLFCLYFVLEKEQTTLQIITFKSSPIVFSKFVFGRTQIDLVYSEHVAHADGVQAFWVQHFQTVSGQTY